MIPLPKEERVLPLLENYLRKASPEDRPSLVKTFLRYEREGSEANGLENEPGPQKELPKEREERILRSLAQCLWDNAPLYLLREWDDLAKKGQELDDL